MSGGHFDYIQYRFGEVVESIRALARDENYSTETRLSFIIGAVLLARAGVYVQRIDWLVCGDDGEESFHRRLREDLSKLEEASDE